MAIAIIGLAFPAAGTYIIGALKGVALAVAGFFTPALPQIAVTLVITFVCIGLYIYRRNYSKKKILLPTSSPAPLQSGLLQTNPLASPGVAQTVLPSDTIIETETK